MLGMFGVVRDALRGAVAGAAAVWLMDLVTTAMLDRQSSDVTRREEAAQPGGKPAVDNLVARLEAEYDVTLADDQRDALIQLIHYGLGVFPGAVYGALRGRIPFVDFGNGVLYGIALFAINDEYLNWRLGLSGEFGAYPMETHWRGLIGHIVLGMATDTGIELLGG